MDWAEMDTNFFSGLPGGIETLFSPGRKLSFYVAGGIGFFLWIHYVFLSLEMTKI
jgi:hypothetical protein